MSDAVRDASGPEQWIRVCVVFAALLGWVPENDVLTDFGSDLVPMAPGTAMLFGLYALALFLRARTPSHHMTPWAGRIVTSTEALAALVLLMLSPF